MRHSNRRSFRHGAGSAILAAALVVGCTHAGPAEADNSRPKAMRGQPGQGMGHGAGMAHGMMGQGMMGAGMMKMGGMHNPLMGMVHGIMSNADELKLSDEQIGKLHRIAWKMKTEKAEEGGPLEVHAAKQSLHDAMMNPAATDKEILAASKKLNDAHEEHVKQMLQKRAELMAVLNEKQKTQLKGMAEQFKNPH